MDEAGAREEDTVKTIEILDDMGHRMELGQIPEEDVERACGVIDSLAITGEAAFLGFDDGAGVVRDQAAQQGSGVLDVAQVAGAVQAVQAGGGAGCDLGTASARCLPAGDLAGRRRPRPGSGSGGPGRGGLDGSGRSR